MSADPLKGLSVDTDGRLWFELMPGVKAEVVSDAEAEAVDFVVCGPISYFSDDIHTTCAFCGTPIVHRPNAPSGPPKVCMPCAIETAKRGRQ